MRLVDGNATLDWTLDREQWRRLPSGSAGPEWTAKLLKEEVKKLFKKYILKRVSNVYLY